MSLSDNPADKQNTLINISSGSTQHIETCSLVLTAVAIPHYIPANKSQLLVKPQNVNQASLQLENYFAENKNWPPVKEEVETIFPKPAAPPTLLIMGIMTLFFWITGPWEINNPWFQIGAINSNAILNDHQWWRLVTALTLHADDVHLLGNCIIGGFMTHLLCKTIGTGTGWFFIIITGCSGNLLNILLRSAEHNSVGFSTAVFGSIGIFTGLQICKGHSGYKNFLAPLGSGIGLLAMLGSEGERTDLGAHFFGLLCGVLAGMLIKKFNLINLTNQGRLQIIIFLITLLFLQACWMAAWRHSSIPLMH